MPTFSDFWPEHKCNCYSGPVTIVEMCLDLHMGKTGSSSCLSQEKVDLYIKCLQWKLANWNDASYKHAFDDRIKELIVETLRERKLLVGSNDLKVYSVSFEIGETKPEGERQSVEFLFLTPPSEKDLIKVVNAQIEKRGDKPIWGEALLDYFSYVNKHRNGVIWVERVVHGH